MENGKFIDASKVQRREVVEKVLEHAGYKFQHPTLILDGCDNWFVIITPNRPPFQMIVHLNGGNECDFFATIRQLVV